MCDYEKTCLGEFAGQGEASYVFADKSNEDVAKAALKIVIFIIFSLKNIDDLSIERQRNRTIFRTAL